jgi:hypothetical protein
MFSNRRIHRTLSLGALSILVLCLGCFNTSRIARNVGVDHNGGFEEGGEGKPINWNVYHKGLKRGKAELTYDTEDFREGVRSLKFSVSSCSGAGDWQSPGVFQEVDVQANSAYRISYWLKNNQCRFDVKVNPIKEDAPRQGTRVLSEEGLGSEWSEYSSTVNTGVDETKIRFELNITGPGILWLDNVDIQEVEGN